MAFVSSKFWRTFGRIWTASRTVFVTKYRRHSKFIRKPKTFFLIFSWKFQFKRLFNSLSFYFCSVYAFQLNLFYLSIYSNLLPSFLFPFFSFFVCLWKNVTSPNPSLKRKLKKTWIHAWVCWAMRKKEREKERERGWSECFGE